MSEAEHLTTRINQPVLILWLHRLKGKSTIKKIGCQFIGTLLLTTLFFFVTETYAQWLPDVRLTNNPAESDLSLNNARCVAVSAEFVHVIWGDYRTGPARRIYYKRSINKGISWEPDVELTNHPAGSGFPSVAVSDSSVHVTWTDVRNGHYDIYYNRSLDNGLNWDIDTRLTIDPAGSRNPSIAVSGEYLHVVFRDNRNSNEQIYYKRSTDAGLSWVEDTRISNTTSLSEFPSVSASAENVIIVWQDNRDGNLEIYSRRSTDNGVNWETETRLTSDPGSSLAPSVIASNEFLNVVWQDNRDGNYEIYHLQSFDNGITWSTEARLTDNSFASTYPSVTVSGETIHTFWQDNRDGNTEIYYKHSTDSGLHWEPDLRLTDNSSLSQYVSSATSDTVVHIVWQDNRDGNHEIYYKSKLTGNSVGISDNNPDTPGTIELVQNYPNPFNPTTKISWQSPEGSWQTLKVYDALGNEISTLVNEYRPMGKYEVEFDATDLPSGVYFYQLLVPALPSKDGKVGSYVETKKMILLK